MAKRRYSKDGVVPMVHVPRSWHRVSLSVVPNPWAQLLAELLNGQQTTVGKMKDWCRINLTTRSWKSISPQEWAFRHESDRALFLLTWQQ